VDNERDKHIRVRVGDREFSAGKSRINGHFSTELMLTDEFVAPLAKRDEHGRRWLSFTTVMSGDDVRRFHGKVALPREEGITVLSDIDDTIRITQVHDKAQAFARTFLRPFEPVPGMADLYRGWADRGASFHYVSGSPWQLYPLLRVFLKGQRFPEASFDLREFRPKDTSITAIFDHPAEAKLKKIEPMMEHFSRRRFILVGDSGESDPEVYGELARKHPDRVMHIFIRNVTDESPENKRFQKAFERIGRERWQLFNRGDELMNISVPASPTTSQAGE
jgi:phosphatidate phosphatase APP1